MSTPSKANKLLLFTVCTIVALLAFLHHCGILAPTINTVLNQAIPSLPPSITQLSHTDYANGEKRAADAAQRVTPRLTQELSEKNLSLGAPVFIRIFKESRELEFWIESAPEQSFKLFKTYKIAAMSGELGPKLAEGDRQAPEGFYFVEKSRMNPQSRYHLAFNIGYPNAYDRSHQLTGSAIMVHGNQVSIGCFAMTDHYIEEIYTLCDAALKRGQPYFRVHSFPFRLTTENLAAHRDSTWITFWQSLAPGYAHFETHRRPPNITVSNQEYVVVE